MDEKGKVIDIKKDLPGICDIKFNIIYMEQEIRKSTVGDFFLLIPPHISAGDYPFYEELKENKVEKKSRILNISSLGVDQYARALPEPSKGGYDGAAGEHRIGRFKLLPF